MDNIFQLNRWSSNFLEKPFELYHSFDFYAFEYFPSSLSHRHSLVLKNTVENDFSGNSLSFLLNAVPRSQRELYRSDMHIATIDL